jgi:capsular exopolysaccharide synthesis family protein
MSSGQTGPSGEDEKRARDLVTTPRSLPAARGSYGAYGEVGAYAGYASESDAAGSFGPEFREYLRIIRKRKWLIVGIVAAFVVLGGVRTLMMTPVYTATVRLQIDRNAAKVVDSGNVSAAGEGGEYEFLKTQYELLQSRALAERVASALKLGDDASFLQPREFSPLAFLKGLVAAKSAAVPTNSQRADRERAAVGVISGNRSIRPVPGSLLVDVSYSDPDPARAQRIVTALTQAYGSANLDKRFEANAYAKTFLEDQLKQLKLRLELSDRELLAFAEKEQIVVVTEKSSIAENNLASANAALGTLISERIKNEQQWKQVAAADAINMPQLLTNKVIEGLRAERNALVTEYQQKLETFKPSYPAMVQNKNKVAEIDRQLAHEVQTIKDSLKASYEASLSQEAEMKKQIGTLRAELLDLQKRSVQYNILKREVDTNRSLYEGLLQRYREVDVAGGVGANNVFVVDKAQVPSSPSSPNLSRALLLSFALGLGAGLASAYVLERIDDTVQSIEDIERLTGLATLGIIPRAGADGRVETELDDPRSSVAEAYRSLCTALQFSTENGLPKSLLVTSAGPGEGKSSTALAIARHFATMGLKVLLIDADLRNPSLHVKLGGSKEIGLSTYLTGGCTPPEAMQKTAITNLAFMASGPLPPNAADLLGNARLVSLLSVGLEIFDLIVFDGPPVLGLADAPLLASASAATIFVVGAGEAHLGQVRGAMKRLQFGRGVLIGTVLTKFDAKAAGYGSDYGYGYGYGGGAESSGHRPAEANPLIGRNGHQAELARADMG